MKTYRITFKKTPTARAVFFITREALNVSQARGLAQMALGNKAVILAVVVE